MNICIGIVSYFPDNAEVRAGRQKRASLCLRQCKKLFNLPVIIIAQNWKNDCRNLEKECKKIIFYKDRLGICAAREELREFFIASEYDYMIMLDDDSLLKGSILSVKKYLYLIRENPDGAILRRGSTLIKLVAISKNIAKQIRFDIVNPEKNEGYEDAYVTFYLRRYFKDKISEYDMGLTEMSNSENDPYSTWSNKAFVNRKLLYENNAKILNKIEEEKLNEQ